MPGCIVIKPCWRALYRPRHLFVHVFMSTRCSDMILSDFVGVLSMYQHVMYQYCKVSEAGWRAWMILHGFLDHWWVPLTLFHTCGEWASSFDRTKDDHQGMSPALSECARFAPRFGGAVRRFALRALIDGRLPRGKPWMVGGSWMGS